ncbi:hypothetical protein M3J09_005441 [Ascochyta lentis]
MASGQAWAICNFYSVQDASGLPVPVYTSPTVLPRKVAALSKFDDRFLENCRSMTARTLLSP